jgi:hypothetical protein
LPSAENKGGFGFHPLGAWCDTTGEPLGAIFRPGNAGANDADDHLELLDQVIAVLPGEYQLGHEPGDEASLVRHHIVVRADSAGASHGFVSGLTEASIEYSIGHSVDSGVREALLLFQEEDWVEAIEVDGTVRDGAWVAELTDLMDLSTWGEEVSLRRVEMSTFTGQMRGWGTSNPRYWASLDPKRRQKSVALILDVGRYVRPFITPDDPDAVEAIIREQTKLGPNLEGTGDSPFV